MTRLRVVLPLLALLGGCGVKAPPRASGAPDKAAPHELFKTPEDPNRPPRSAQEPSR